MNDMTRSASSEASALIEDFLAANPLPSSEQWKAFTLAHPAHASQIADTALMLTLDDADFDAEELDVELFNATRSAMLNEVHLNSVPVAAAKTALKVCRGRQYADAAVAAERADAERYRWLRSERNATSDGIIDVALWKNCQGTGLRGDDLDAAIDAARASGTT